MSNFLFLGVPSSLGTFTCRLISNGLPRMPAVVPPTRLAQGREQGSNRQEWGGRERRMDRGPWYPPQRDLLVLSALMTTWTESQGTTSPRIIKAKDTTSNMAICTFQSSTNLTLARLTNMYTATAFFLSLILLLFLLLPSFSPQPLPLHFYLLSQIAHCIGG